MSNKKIFFIAAIVLAAGLLFSVHDSTSSFTAYQNFKTKLAVDFTEAEDVYRFKIFESNLNKVNQHNSKLNKGHEEELNQFAFLTQEEFAAKYLSTVAAHSAVEVITEESSNGPTVDWVTYGAVSPVQNQGSCTASYAFSAVGAIEGISVIYLKTQQVYSVQQVVDCSQSYGNNGCYNGRMDATFSYVKDKGINTAAAYPYTGTLGTCKTSSGLFRIAGYANITDCTNLANALTFRPISVVVDGANFQFYKSGVFYNCGTNLSLPTLLVGMTDSFWNLKNSWGQAWGEAGYIRIARGNTCGVCMVASYPYVN